MNRATRSYWASVRAIQKETGATIAESRAAWRGISDRLGHRPSGREISRHPRITAQEVRKVERPTARQEQITRYAERGPEAPSADIRASYRDVDEWIDDFDLIAELDDAEYEVDGAVDYEEQ